MQHAGTTPKNPHQMWQFAVEIGGFDTAYFRKCGGVTVNNEVSKFAPGGSLFDQKAPGRMSFDPVTLEKGKSQVGTDNAVVQWLADIADMASGIGKLGTVFRQVDIVEYDREGAEIRRYRLHDAFISKVQLGEYDGSSSEPTIENMTLDYQFADLVE